MSLVFTRKTEPKNNPRFCVTVSWEHGDADHTSYHTSQFKGWTDEQLLQWVAKFRTMAQQIGNLRSYGNNEGWYGDENWERALGIEVARDCVYDGSGHPAQPSIDKIEYVDFDDVRFTVTGF
ncbi:hypothetical protein Roomu2_00095 [Pseudomonas phage vB_PpuM-Roomu-2]|uniref:Uncharacterized protein n=1 Tax=Pseudomonas phage vB_PpuM-Roomu-2 TaxID=3132621 RepID=A0AAX4MYE5_9CAUD